VSRLRQFLRHTGLVMWKEALQLSRDRGLLPLILVVPVVQLIMFGYVVGSDVRNLPTAVVDQDNTTMSRKVIDAFTGSTYFTVVAHPGNESGIKPLMDGNQVTVAIIIPRGFENGVRAGRSMPVEVVVDSSDSKTSQVAAGYSQSILASLSSVLYPARPGVDLSAVPGVDARVRVLFNPSLSSVNVMVPGLMAIVLLLSGTTVMAQAVVRERERGTLEQLFVTPISRTEYLLGKVLPYAVVATVQITVVFIVGTLWFRVPFSGSLAVVGAASLLFMFTTLGIGLLISTVSKTRQQAQQATMFILIPSFVLSGFIFPIESMPLIVQPLTLFVPLRYILVALRSNFLKGSGFVDLWPQFFAMTIFAVGVFALAVWRFRKRLAD
jgi:ABC-2 type transport system permease protein